MWKSSGSHCATIHSAGLVCTSDVSTRNAEPSPQTWAERGCFGAGGRPGSLGKKAGKEARAPSSWESRPRPGLAERSRFLAHRQTVRCHHLRSLQEGSRGLCPWKAWPLSWPQSPSAPLWGHAGSGSCYTESVRPSSLCLSVRTFNGRSTPLTN